MAKRRNEEDSDRDITLAYNIATLTRGSKGLPKLDTLLSKNRKKSSARQSPLEQSAMWQIAAMRFGGQFKPLDPKTVIRG